MMVHKKYRSIPMKYEEIALNDTLELSDTELETIVGGGQHRGWSDNDDNDGGWWRHCHRRNGGQDYGNQPFGDQSFGDQGYGSQYFGGQRFANQSYDRDDRQRRCRR
jgi:hypothetical protein